jgi:hypothetical protein
MTRLPGGQKVSPIENRLVAQILTIWAAMSGLDIVRVVKAVKGVAIIHDNKTTKNGQAHPRGACPSRKRAQIPTGFA